MRFLRDDVLDHLCEVTDAPDLAGTRYELGEVLGRGGMGTVYAARDRELDREVAIKVSATAASSELGERLLREARILAELEHPGIVPVHDRGVLPDGRAYYVMKRVRGERLDVWAVKAERRAALRLFQRVCEAVAFAHAYGVIHRDLKPENVMVGAFGEALVMDWGIAKRLRDGGTSDDGDASSPTVTRSAGTRHGTVMGTPEYMPPEQERGDVTAIDARSDVFALGTLLGFLVEAGSEKDVPPPLASIRAKACQRDPALRHASALELSLEVGRWLDGERVLGHHEGWLERVSRFAVRNQIVLLLLAAYLVLRLILVAVAP